MNPYHHFKVKSYPNDIDVAIDEPDLVNPSGLESISNILQNLGRIAGIKSYVDGKRAWVYIENPAGIDTIVARLIKKHFQMHPIQMLF